MGQIKLGTGEKIYFKDMPSAKEIRLFFNERFNGRAKIKKLNSYTSSGIIMTVEPADEMIFSPPYGYIQSVNFRKKQYTVAVHGKEFPYIYNEVDFFRRFPRDAKKRGVSVI